MISDATADTYVLCVTGASFFDCVYLHKQASELLHFRLLPRLLQMFAPLTVYLHQA